MGFLFGLLNLQFDFIHSYTTFDKLFYQKPQMNGVLHHYYYAATRVSHSWGGWSCNFNWSRPCHTTRFWCGKIFHLLHQHLLNPGIILLSLRVVIFWSRRSRPCRWRDPFHTLVHTYMHTYMHIYRQMEIIKYPNPTEIIFQCQILLSSCVLQTAVRAQPNKEHVFKASGFALTLKNP